MPQVLDYTATKEVTVINRKTVKGLYTHSISNGLYQKSAWEIHLSESNKHSIQMSSGVSGDHLDDQTELSKMSSARTGSTR